MADYFPIVRCLEKDPWEWGWDALVAIGTIGLAAVTVWISIRTDRKIDARIKDRERRDAIPLATAIQQEMQEIMAFSYKAKP